MTTYKGFDIDKLSESLNEKVDIDLSNIQPLNSAKGRIASWSFPNYSEETFELGNSGTIYTAPANGYYKFSIKSTGADGLFYIYATNLDTGYQQRDSNTHPASGNQYTVLVCIPAKKGERIKIEYSIGPTVIDKHGLFIYADGDSQVDSGSSIDAATIRQMIATQIASGWNDAFPVGSLYFGETSTCPIATLIPGSTWALVSSGRVIQGSDGTHSAGTTIEAGLPNITGRVGYSRNLASSSGAFTTTNVSEPEVAGSGSNATQIRKIDFSAKRSNAIYGNSDTVQPPAYVVNIWKRTA